MKVCMFLGPLNNMTTLAATALAFHPNVQVVNHGARYLWESRGCNFLKEFTEDSFQRFVDEALRLSLASGISGYPAGSILVSHTFNDSAMVFRYLDRYGPEPMKEDVRCIVWKDPMELQRYMHRNLIDINKLFLNDDNRLRFILPIRNPMDTTISIGKGSNWKHYEDLESTNWGDLLDRVLSDIHRFAWYAREHPGRYLWFTQDSFPVDYTLLNVAAFLGLEPDDRWMRDCKEIWEPRPSYKVPAQLRDFYKLTVKLKFAQFPNVCDALLPFGDVVGERDG